MKIEAPNDIIEVPCDTSDPEIINRGSSTAPMVICLWIVILIFIYADSFIYG